jgi:hypothetical protein
MLMKATKAETMNNKTDRFSKFREGTGLWGYNQKLTNIVGHWALRTK